MAKKVINQTLPIKHNKSETTYRLIEADGKLSIEKMSISFTHEIDIQEGQNPEDVFYDFIQKKSENRERNKLRISTKDAWILHYRDSQSWRHIAQEAGNKSGVSLANRGSSYTSDLAFKYMNGADIYALAEDHDLSPNHMSTILTEYLERYRAVCIEECDYRGIRPRDYKSAFNKVSNITRFLNDYESLDCEFVNPYDDTDQTVGRKSILYTDSFYEVIFEDQTKARISAEVMEALSYSSDTFYQASDVFGFHTSKSIIDVKFMGKVSEQSSINLLRKSLTPLKPF